MARGDYPVLQITPRGKEVVWQRVVPQLEWPTLVGSSSKVAGRGGASFAETSDYDPLRLPYDPKYYLKKLEDWVTRYDAFIEVSKPVPTEQQGELL